MYKVDRQIPRAVSGPAETLGPRSGTAGRCPSIEAPDAGRVTRPPDPWPGASRPLSPAAFARRFTGHPAFQPTVLALIVANAAMIGFETHRPLLEAHAALFTTLNAAFQAAFVAEILLRVTAHGARPLAFFRDGWNTFDFLVVGASLLPGSGDFANVARLARLLRATRVVSSVPELRLIVGTMLKSIPSMGHVLLLVGLLIYVYGVLGHHLFGTADPASWGSLPAAATTLFQVLTLEGWVELMRAGGRATPVAWAFYASFIVVAVFVVINLFIAVVLNNLEAAKREQQAAEDAARGHAELLARLADVRERLNALEHWLRARAPADGGPDRGRG
uniref:Ion transporter n=1 Tax=Eiseniibacteriota bacterium TaxID=2212470 RepID=A0A832IA53_UNCEI